LIATSPDSDSLFAAWGLMQDDKSTHFLTGQECTFTAGVDLSVQSRKSALT